MKKSQVPIFCDNCANLALAELHHSPLCLSCLLSVVKKSKDPSIIRQTQPLGIEGVKVRGLAKTWPKQDTDSPHSMG
jgi:hypothetical protein